MLALVRFDQLLTSCHEYAESKLSLDELKAAVWSTASALTNPRERELREFLQGSEGQLDLIQFTVEESEIRLAALEVVKAIEGRLAARILNS